MAGATKTHNKVLKGKNCSFLPSDLMVHKQKERQEIFISAV